MEQYISKYALVAEIKRRLWLLVPKMTFHQQRVELEKLLAFIDTLEVKEVQEEPVSEELEKEIGKVLTDYYGTRYDDETTVELSAFDIVNIAHHFAKWGENQAKVEIQAQSMALAHGCPEEPVSEDLEEAAEEWDESLYRSDAFKTGAKWQLNKIRNKYEENRN